ncbi:hypothetical protein HC931_10560 [Candidatus Gracilibacteria bacterium]|nr:hypothetical protein [Candidatus Gracilibacteria bacterium]NJM87783.1 hypothetical protein [Hydrococcus sp. RU_2_2]NJP18417.1 hypothetical protein [Hydrococcus sp. CRU_1_1]
MKNIEVKISAIAMPPKIQSFQSYWFGLLFVIMAVVTTHFFEWGMAGLSTFILAYLTKGIRVNK